MKKPKAFVVFRRNESGTQGVAKYRLGVYSTEGRKLARESMDPETKIRTIDTLPGASFDEAWENFVKNFKVDIPDCDQ